MKTKQAPRKVSARRPRTKGVRETPATYLPSAPVNKTLLGEMIEAYRARNIEKERERARIARERTPTQAFETFSGLWEFGRKFASHHPYQRQEKIASMQLYYERIKEFEAWRRSRAN